MKKIVCLLLVLVLLLPLWSCKKSEIHGIAFICSPAGVTERYEGQALKAAISDYCEKNSIPFYEYISDGSDDYYQRAAEGASNVANLAVCDSVSSKVIAEISGDYSVPFLFVNYRGDVPQNCRAIYFAEEEAGFFAGYAAAFDGNLNLAFLGGEKNEMSQRYLSGFIQGVEVAAEGKLASLSWYFTGKDEASDQTKEIAQTMFVGADVLFVCGGGIYKSAVLAANSQKKFLIGAEMDQAGESERFITSAYKDYAGVMEEELSSFMENKAWKEGKSGQSIMHDYKNTQKVGIPEYNGAFRFKIFTSTALEEMQLKVKSGDIKITLGTELPNTSLHVAVHEFTPRNHK